MAHKQRFLSLYKEHITREGGDKFLEFLLSDKSDFFVAPASTRFHGNYEGGLCEHVLNVFDCLENYLARTRVKSLYGLDYPMESIAIVSLLHDVCKIGCYKKGYRNQKDEKTGQWNKVEIYEFDDDLPYGHGEKSVYIISGYMKLTREEAFAIRFHMGFTGTEPVNLVGKAFEKYPLAFATSVADMESTYFLEKSNK